MIRMGPSSHARCGVAQAELAARAQARQISRAPRAPRHYRLPRWNVSWMRLSPGDEPGVTGTTGQARSSWMIIISAGRPG
ncbi:MAG: hypothetical protein ABSF03_11765 [Streptosporangiaceae bacterium]